MTRILAVIMVLLFALEQWWGGFDYVPTLVRMGANIQSKVLAGEVWRLVTSIFLHGGYLHVFFNVYVLLVLGTFINRLMGNAAYLTLFFISGIAGSLTSVYLGHAEVSVGASGALWGLFGASAALVMRPSTLVSEPIRKEIRRATLINIVINLAISFLPTIDLWAHLGGGIAGFILGDLFIRTMNCSEFYKVTSRFLTVVALASFVMAFQIGQPWVLTKNMKLETRPFSADFSVGIPSYLTVQDSGHFGQIPFDPLEIAISVRPFAQENLQDIFRNFVRETGLSLQAGRPFLHDGHQALKAQVELRDGRRYDVWWQLQDEQLIQLEIVVMPDSPKEISEGVPRIFESLYSNSDVI